MKRIHLCIILVLTAGCQAGSPMTPSITLAPQSATPTATLPASNPHTTPPPPTRVTSTPVPRFFIEEFNLDFNAWVSFQTGGASSPEIRLENGLLRFDVPSPNSWYYAIHNIHQYEDVQVVAKFTATPSGSMGLVCRYNDSGWFEFNIASDGTYSVLFAHWLGETIAQYTPIRNETSEYLQPGTLSYEIGLTCQQDYLLLHVNGKLFRKIDVARYGLTSGRIGLSISSFDETPMIAAFDWVTVSEPGQ